MNQKQVGILTLLQFIANVNNKTFHFLGINMTSLTKNDCKPISDEIDGPQDELLNANHTFEFDEDEDFLGIFKTYSKQK